jgi:TonB family protein
MSPSRVAANICCAFFLVNSAAPPARASRLEDKAVEVGPGIKPPSGPGLIVLETPEDVAESNAHATLTLRVLVDKSGRVRRAEALDAPDPLLAAVAVKSLVGMRFPPAMRDETPVVVWWDTKVVFRPRAELDAQHPSLDCVPAAYELAHLDALTEHDELPRLLEKVEPVYPPKLRAERVEGQAKFACVIDTCGQVRDCRVLSASLGEFARAGLAAVVRRRYVPALRDGKPFTVMFTIALTFTVW